MKYSIYNTWVPLSNKLVLLYNAFSDTFLIFKADIVPLVQNDLPYVKTQWPSLYRNLVKNGCYVADNLDEYEKLKAISKAIAEDDTTFLLVINPTLDCNLSCWYCYENHRKGSLMDSNILRRVQKFMSNVLKEPVKNFTLAFFGGEPLMKYDSVVSPCMKFAKGLCDERGINLGVSFTTNGTLLTEKKIAEITSLCASSFQITLDGAEKVHDKVRFYQNGEGSYRAILDNVKKLLEYGAFVTLRLNYTKDNIKSFYEVVDEIKTIGKLYRKKLLIDYHRVWQDDSEELYSCDVRKQAEVLNDEGFVVQCRPLRSIKSPCYGDKKNTAVINYDGDVFKCTAKDFIPENREGYLNEDGNIVWEKSQEHRLSLKLRNELCHKCSIAPICGGGCSRYILEREVEGGTYCMYGQNSKVIQEVVKNQVEHILRTRNLQLNQ